MLISVCSCGSIERLVLTKRSDDLQRTSEFHHSSREIDRHSNSGPHQEVKWRDGINTHGFELDSLLELASFDY